MAAPPKHQPPPLAWRTPPTAQAHTAQAHTAQAKPGAPSAAPVAQPLRAFSPHQRPQGGRNAPAGDELVGGGDGRFQLRRHESHLMSRPDGVYNFVRVQGATRNQSATMMSARAPHASLADGRPVLYAGTAAFNGGQLQWWSNYSGTYQPQAEFNRQAALPTDKFVPWQKLQLGGVGLQRGMLSDRRADTVPNSDPPPKPAKPEAAKPPSPPSLRATSSGEKSPAASRPPPSVTENAKAETKPSDF